MARDWGHLTLMGSPAQRELEQRWRQQVADLRRDVEVPDMAMPQWDHIGSQWAFTDDDIYLLEAVIDGCSTEDVAMFIYMLLAERNSAYR